MEFLKLEFVIRMELLKLELIYSVMPISAIQQCDPVIHICMYVYIYILFLMLSFIVLHPKRLDIVPCAVQ